jgi:hypothetical protein
MGGKVIFMPPCLFVLIIPLMIYTGLHENYFTAHGYKPGGGYHLGKVPAPLQRQ